MGLTFHLYLYILIKSIFPLKFVQSYQDARAQGKGNGMGDAQSKVSLAGLSLLIIFGHLNKGYFKFKWVM